MMFDDRNPITAINSHAVDQFSLQFIGSKILCINIDSSIYKYTLDGFLEVLPSLDNN